MRVLQQCIYFPPEVGGLESHVYYLCRELVRLGHEVTMLTSRSMPGLARDEVMDGVRVLRRWMPARNPAGWVAHTAATVPAYLRLARDADVLHAQTFASAPPGMLARRRGRPLVLTLHTSHFLRLAKRPLWRPALRRIISSADWLLAASEEIRDVALELYPHPRAEALTNGVDTDVFAPDAAAAVARIGAANAAAAVADVAAPDASATAREGVRRLIVPRRLFEKNGVEYLVRAMPLLLGEHAVEAWIVGDGPERPKLESLARALGIADHVRFLGARPNSEMPGLLASADVAVIPSLMEATSVAALEAMSCGVPVAASNVGGLPEIVDESVGTLFPPGDPPALAASVATLLRRDDLDALGRRARERVVENWSVARLARRHVEIYEELLRA